MKLIFPGFFAITLMLFSCHPPVDSNMTANQPDPLDIASHDSSVKPQSNFYLFANGTWLKTTEIPPSQSSWGAFSTLLDTSLNRLNRILDSLSGISNAPKGSIAQQTGDLFVSAMDSAGIEK
ncbi:MAG TPA: M13 family metallopeptidase N-terminal domain-containing protein, partial [Puia sp.]